MNAKSRRTKFEVGMWVRCHANCLSNPTKHRCFTTKILAPYVEDGWWRVSVGGIAHEDELEPLPKHVFMFQPRFAPLVLDGTKTTTIRAPRKRAVSVGDILDLRQWSGRPYASKQIKLREVVCARVEPIEIMRQWDIIIGGLVLPVDEAAAVAYADGFGVPMKMFRWFEKNHGLPFTGTLYRWRTA